MSVVDSGGGLYPNQYLGIRSHNQPNTGVALNAIDAPLTLNTEAYNPTGPVGVVGATFHSGTGTPQGHIAGNVGDLYFRIDTPLTSNQRVYICSVAGVTPGGATWTGIV